MTITVDITPEVQAELARQAAAQGRALETYAARLLEEAAHVPASSVKPDDPTEAKDMVELFAPVRRLLTDDEIDRVFSRNKSTGPEPAHVTAEVVEACERLKTFGKSHGLSLGGLTIRELRQEARP